MINQEKLELIAKELIKEIGDNPNRIGLKDTPKRMAKMWIEIFKGYDKKQFPKITIFPNNEDGIKYDQIIIDEGKAFSFCEHHMSLFNFSYKFGYIPNNHIIGLSKIARLIDYYSARLQVQERIGEQVCSYLEKILKPKGLILVIKGNHTCKSIRGVKKDGAMITSIVKGVFEEQPATRQEFLSLIKL